MNSRLPSGAVSPAEEATGGYPSGTQRESVCQHAADPYLARQLSAFWTREDPQPTSEFDVACPCPDGLMQDETQEGDEAYIILHRGARSRGYKLREREGSTLR